MLDWWPTIEMLSLVLILALQSSFEEQVYDNRSEIKILKARLDLKSEAAQTERLSIRKDLDDAIADFKSKDDKSEGNEIWTNLASIAIGLIIKEFAWDRRKRNDS